MEFSWNQVLQSFLLLNIGILLLYLLIIIKLSKCLHITCQWEETLNKDMKLNLYDQLRAIIIIIIIIIIKIFKSLPSNIPMMKLSSHSPIWIPRISTTPMHPIHIINPAHIVISITNNHSTDLFIALGTHLTTTK